MLRRGGTVAGVKPRGNIPPQCRNPAATRHWTNPLSLTALVAAARKGSGIAHPVQCNKLRSTPSTARAGAALSRTACGATADSAGSCGRRLRDGAPAYWP